MNDRLDSDEELCLIALAQAGDRDAETRLLLAHLPPAYSIVNRYLRRNAVPKEDLEQEAALGLVTAVRRFDPDRGVRFVTYATWWVRARVQRACQRWYSFCQESPCEGTRWIENIPDEKPAPAVGVDLRLLRRLPPRQRNAVELVLGLNGHAPHSRPQMAVVLGVQLAAANKLYTRAMARLRWLLRPRVALPRRAA